MPRCITTSETKTNAEVRSRFFTIVRAFPSQTPRLLRNKDYEIEPQQVVASVRSTLVGATPNKRLLKSGQRAAFVLPRRRVTVRAHRICSYCGKQCCSVDKSAPGAPFHLRQHCFLFGNRLPFGKRLSWLRTWVQQQAWHFVAGRLFSSNHKLRLSGKKSNTTVTRRTTRSMILLQKAQLQSNKHAVWNEVHGHWQARWRIEVC